MAIGPETAGYYATAPLAKTLADLIDPANARRLARTRLTVGAANVQTGEMHYFDSRDRPLSVRHVMASGALPPAFPAMRIDGELYWDGGILSNTPVEAVFDDNPRRSGAGLRGQHLAPRAGRAGQHLEGASAARRTFSMPAAPPATSPGRSRSTGCATSSPNWRHSFRRSCGASPEIREPRRLWLPDPHACGPAAGPAAGGEDHTKDIDFSPDGIRARWAAGYADTARVLAQARGRIPTIRSKASSCTTPAWAG